MLCGLPGTGKTTLAKKIEELYSFSFFSIRDTRRLLNHKTYQPEKNYEVFMRIYSDIRASMNKRQSIVFDSNATSTSRRFEIIEIANLFSYPVVIIECICLEKEAKKRIVNRFQVKDGLFEDSNDPTVHNLLGARWINLSHIELSEINVNYVVYDSSKNSVRFAKVKENLKLGLLELFEKTIG